MKLFLLTMVLQIILHKLDNFGQITMKLVIIHRKSDQLYRTGTLNSRFVGYQTAIGKYILSLDLDDEFVPGFLNRLHYIFNLEKRIEMLHFRILEVFHRKINRTSVYKIQIGYK